MTPAPHRSALLLIDLQRSFCDPHGSMAKQGRDIAPMQAAARACARLADAAHRTAIPVIFTRMQFRADYADGGRLVTAIRPNLAKIGALQAGTFDAELADGIGYKAGDTILDKARYSALYATALEICLRASDVARVIVGGVTTSMCVESTVRDLGQRDYEVIVAREACGDFAADRYDASLAAMAFGFATIESLDHCLGHLAAR